MSTTPNGRKRKPMASKLQEPTHPLSPAELHQVKLMIAVPTYQGVVHSGCMLSLFKLTHILRTQGIKQEIRLLDGEMVARARNRMVADFLDSDCTHLLFVDSDITFDPDQLIRMLQANLSVIGGVYPKKTIRWTGGFAHAQNGGNADTMAEASLDYVVNALPNSKGKMVRDCIEVSYVGTGFLLIQRRVLVTMVAKRKDLKYADDFVGTAGRTLYAVFDYKIVGSRYLSEDYYYCELWRSLGGSVWASATCKLSHAGMYIFQGDFGKRLKPSPRR